MLFSFLALETLLQKPAVRSRESGPQAIADNPAAKWVNRAHFISPTGRQLPPTAGQIELHPAPVGNRCGRRNRTDLGKAGGQAFADACLCPPPITGKRCDGQLAKIQRRV